MIEMVTDKGRGTFLALKVDVKAELRLSKNIPQ
jgi:hypothetical protein